MTEEQIHHFLIHEVQFTFAKTMANIPHSWICRKDYSDLKFLEVMNFIKYWVMTDSQDFDDPTAIINKAKI